MTEVFITNIESQIQAEKSVNFIQDSFADLKINFDLNEKEFPFPCGHTILRVEGDKVNSKEIIALLDKSGYKCEILEDKICS